MTTTSVARSERLLDAIGKRIGLTDSGKQWLIGAVDPFHDTPLRIDGYPDVNEASSVVQVIKLSQSFSVPGSVSSGNWDCHVVQFPWATPTTALGGTFVPESQAPVAGGGLFTLNNAAISTGKWGGLGVASVAATQSTWTENLGSTETRTFPFATKLATYLNDEYRVIGMGFEVINTTSDLNIQGLVTCYRMPFVDIDSAKTVLVNGSTSGPPVTTTFGWIDVATTTCVPINPQGALLLEGSAQWKAKEGAYVVSTLNSQEVPTGNAACGIAMQLDPADPAFVAGVNDFILTLPVAAPNVAIPPTTSTNILQFIGAPSTATTKFNYAGAYFQGLSNTTTLTIDAVYIIEKFPSQLDTALVVLATPSARMDPQALDLYSEVIRSMPVGVPQRMNGMGEWFADAISEASNFIAPVLSSIPLPMAQMASKGLSVAGGIAKKFGSVPSKPPVAAPGKTYNSAGNQSVMAKGATQKKKKQKKNKK
jgi:hypothetical protein